jgi:hypothetical protein
MNLPFLLFDLVSGNVMTAFASEDEPSWPHALIDSGSP